MTERSAIEIAKAAGYVCVLGDAAPIPATQMLRPTMRAGKEILNWHVDGRGGLVELWRRSWSDWDGSDDPPRDDNGVNQAYISETLPGVVKGWHAHPPTDAGSQTDRFVVVRGRVLVATYDLLDPPEDGAITERVLDGNRLERIDIAPMVAHGWLALGNETAWVLNLCSLEYDGRAEWRRPAHAGPAAGVGYDWFRNRDG